MKIPQYEFVTRWCFEASPDLVYDLLSEPLDYPKWMKRLSIQVTSVSKGNTLGIGREDHYELRAFLPYTLRWNLKCTQAERSCRFLSVASGDMEGTGEWTFQPRGNKVDVAFYWKVGVRKPFLRYFSGLLKPVFEWNHNWVMRRWEKDLQMELIRKKEIKSISE